MPKWIPSFITERPLIFIVSLLIAGIVLLSPFYVSKNPLASLVGSSNKMCQGYIDSTPRTDEDGSFKMTVRLDSCRDGEGYKPARGRIRLTVKDDEKNADLFAYRYGDVVRFKSSFKEPADFKNPGGFRFKRYCLAHHIDALGVVADPAWIVKIGRIKGKFFRQAIESARVKISRALEPIKDDDARGIALALSIGDNSRISEDLKNMFRSSGLVHLLVISGLHVGFIALFIFWIIRRSFLFFPRFAERFNTARPTALITIALVWAYAYLTGAQVSVTRAAVMVTVYLAGIVLERKEDIFTALAFAALIIIAGSPFAIYDISFQLSFVTVISIVLLYPRISRLIVKRDLKKEESYMRKAGRYLLEGTLVSFCATLGAAPIIAYYFHYSSLAGVVANILAVPWVGVVLTPLAMITGLVASVSTLLAFWPAKFLGLLIVPFIKMAEIGALLSTRLTISVTPPLTAIFGFYGLILFLIYSNDVVSFGRRIFSNKPRISAVMRFAGPVICAGVIIASFSLQRGWLEHDRLKITFLDVGQGSSIVVIFPDRHVMVVDGGGFPNSDFDVGKTVVAPYLWHEGISKIDRMILTHAHPDHFKGLRFIAEEFKPDIFYWNGIEPGGEEADLEDWKAFKDSVRAIRTVIPMTGAVIPAVVGGDLPNLTVSRRPLSQSRTIGLTAVGVTSSSSGKASNLACSVQFLSPPSSIPSYWTLNDTSIVTKIDYGSFSFLLTGDIESSAEEYFAKSLVTSHLSPVTILQVPHHGSSTSSTQRFLEAVKPSYAVIQAGEKNRYGFPRKEVLDRLSQVGAEIYRTDIDGAIEVTVNSKGTVKIVANK